VQHGVHHYEEIHLSVVGQYTLTETPKCVWRPGSARTHWEAIVLPRPLAIRY